MNRGYVDAATRVHLLPASAKILALFAFVVIVVLTPRQWVAAFVGYAVLLALTAVAARIPARRLAAGFAIEIPFVAFALLLPFLHPGGEGLWAAWNIVIKASLGVMAATILAATTQPVELVAGLQSLRLPGPIVAIFTFFIRYVDVVADQYSRMRVAQKARGMDAASLRAWPVMASGLGALFVRSFERGERVHLALLSRGYDGRMPDLEVSSENGWLAAVLPLSAVAVLASVAVWSW